MPYFIYRVTPIAQLERLAEFDAFQPASVHAKALRVAAGAASKDRIKVIFAATDQVAQDLLRQVREAGPAGDD